MLFTHHFPAASRLVFGCMGLGKSSEYNLCSQDDITRATAAFDTALASGITVFDHADIYSNGAAETVFSRVIANHPDWLNNMIIQSKCGIRFADDKGPKRYDFSADWIQTSLDGILSRLNIEQLDVFLLHRPDPLVEFTTLANCLNALHRAGKFQCIGVSNMHWYQIDALQQHLSMPVIVNQIEMSLAKRDWLESGIGTSGIADEQSSYAPSTIEHHQRHEIQLQAWGPLAQGIFSGRNRTTTCNTSRLVAELAEVYEVSKEAIILAWLIRHPAKIQPVLGTTHPERIMACALATSIALSREHWDALFESARGHDVP